MKRARYAKIVATLGPATQDADMIRQLFQAGVDVFRLNFSHGTHDEHALKIKMIRSIEQEFGHPIGILMDLQGPKLRVGTFEKDAVQLETGATFALHRDPINGTEDGVHFPHPEVWDALAPGDVLRLDDGRLTFTVLEVDLERILCRVTQGGILKDHKGVNIPGAFLPLPALTAQDAIDLEFGLAQGVDMVALSFVQSPTDMAELRARVQGRAALIAKIEKPLALQSLEEIVALSDSIMIARGDLGVEMLPEEVPSAQKRIIQVCRTAGKPVIVATQMLDSMALSPAPTRAEASDVATAIYDGVDAVMLSQETASGAYPIEAVSMMDRIIRRTEADALYKKIIAQHREVARPTVASAITSAARTVVETIQAAAIITYTTSGFTALEAARERPLVPILALTNNLETARRLTLAWGVHPHLTYDIDHMSDMPQKVGPIAIREGLAQEGEMVVVTAGLPFHKMGATNFLRVVTLEAS